ncbi:hypothetical protein GCM10010246_16260 [Streptomyces cuspidosporus]|uniref:Glutamine synthetase n=1 Tax=Streptomyces cuspidosporus TaxID=66882 RepID=A0ABN3FN29_9ACTN
MANNDQRRPRRPCSEAAQEGAPHMADLRHDFLRNKKQEWEEYRSEVTPFELRKNLPVL